MASSTTVEQTHHVSPDILAFLAASLNNEGSGNDADESDDEYDDIWIETAAAAFGGATTNSRRTRQTTDESSSSSINKDSNGRVISFGIPSVPNTTIVKLKHVDDKDDDNRTTSTRSNSSSGSSRSSSSSNNRISFDEDVTVNHVDNFRITLKKSERYSIWYSDTENIKMQVDFMDEKEQAQRAVVAKNAPLNKNNTTASMGNPKIGFSFTKKAKSLASKFFVPVAQRSSDPLQTSLQGSTVTSRAA